MGRFIGRYEIERELGHGGMAVVYLARDPLMKRQVAVKVLPREFTSDPQFRARFQREAEIVAALEHPNIVPVHDFGEHDGQPYLVMRYMSGGSLADRLEHGPLTLAETARLLIPLASALDEAHSKLIVHRDLKPANILFDGRGEPYISDFGIAKLVAETSTRMSSGGVIGTPMYMSPEQWRAETIDGRSDIYALGGILFEVLSGKPPFEADTPAQLMYKHLAEPPPRVVNVRTERREECQAIIAKAMAKDRTDRYRTAGEMSAAVSELVIQTLGPAAASVERVKAMGLPPLAVPPPPRPSRPALGLPILLVFIGSVVLITGLALLPDLMLAMRTSLPTQVAASTAITPVLSRTPRATTTPIPRLAVGATRISEKDDMAQVFVPEGDFLMGSVASDSQADIGEQPQHTVFLDSFWIDQTEVTNAMYQVCIEQGLCSLPDDDSSATRTQYFGNSGYSNYPVIYVSWSDAADYCSWAGRRLPTEAEWEKAARSSDGRTYPWGLGVPNLSLANFNGNEGDTMSVGHYPSGASLYGALDMAGNVWEWVNDCYDPNYYANSPAANPPGPESDGARVLRGGSWGSYDDGLRAAGRSWDNPTLSNSSIGFRCVASP